MLCSEEIEPLYFVPPHIQKETAMEVTTDEVVNGAVDLQSLNITEIMSLVGDVIQV